MTQPTLKQYSPPVAVIAAGACTAVGHCAPTTAASVRAGINRLARHPFMVDSRGDAFLTAHAQYLPIDTDGPGRFLELGLSAANEALGAITEPLGGIKNFPVIIGLPGDRPGFSDKTAGEIVSRFESLTHPFCKPTHAETVRGGHGAGLAAIERGCEAVSGGLAHLCLAGGIDSWINPDDLEWLDALGMTHSDSNPWGIVPGEGAGFCLLVSEKVMEVLDVPARARIRASATAFEKKLINTDTVCVGEGLSRAVALATHPNDPVDQIICDLNGLRYRADEFGFSLVKNANRFKAPKDFLAPADCWGDVGAASGPLFLGLAVHTALLGNEKGPLNLILAGSDTGERRTMLVITPNKREV